MQNLTPKPHRFIGFNILNKSALKKSCLLLFGLITTPAFCAVEMPAVIGSHMVLQSGEPVNFWGWADAGEKIEIKQDGKTLATATGAGKETPWRVKLPPLKAGPVADIEIVGTTTISLTDILAGEVWLCSGQSNMQMTMEKGPWCGWSEGVVDHATEVAAAKDPQIRAFLDEGNGKPTPQSRPKGQWVVCSPETAPKFSATAYYLAQSLRSELKTPVGILISSVGGTHAELWTPKRVLDTDPAFDNARTKAKKTTDELGPLATEDQQTNAAWKKAVEEAKKNNITPPEKPTFKLTQEQSYNYSDARALLNTSELYNGKIFPLAPYNIKGALWYQGENNARVADRYAQLMTDLITGWREDWGKPFPFIMVGLASYSDKKAAWNPLVGSWALIREAQIKVAQTLPQTGVILATDITPASPSQSCSIHPINKKPVGQRAALWALEHVYGKPVISAGPVFGKVMFASGKARVEIPPSPSSAGLTLKSPGGFELAAGDKKFIPATATLINGAIEVSADGITDPVALRYGFVNWPELTVFNAHGLPAFPFRTDQWEIIPADRDPIKPE
ncbi:MAG: sialate O-acetylesterase [Terrimicrobiaceae bacterium]